MFVKLVKLFLAAILRTAFWFRYRMTIVNKEVLKDKHLQKNPVLVLSNHPSETDPLLLLSLAGVSLNLRPVVVENFYHYPGARFFMRLLKAIPVPDFDNAVSELKLQQGENFHREVVRALKEGDNVMIYPSGTLKRQGEERIGGRSGVHRIVQESEGIEILLVRITGLWGSSFSTAQWGYTPPFWPVVIRGFKTALKNFFLFVPRRSVTVEFERVTDTFPFKSTKLELNSYLEDWFNQYPIIEKNSRVKEEPLSVVRERFWSKKLPQLHLARRNDCDDGYLQVPRDIRTNILCKLSEMTGVSVAKIQEHQDIVYDLGLDSIDKAQIFTFLDEQYDIDPAIIPADLVLVRDLFAVALKVKEPLQKLADSTRQDQKKGGWPREKRIPVSHAPNGKTIIEAFLQTSKQRKNTAACADPLTGLMTYRHLYLGVIVLARKIRRMEGKYVGIMLPASNVTAMLVLAVQLAGKVPVMLNWTLGAYFMDHAVGLLDIKTILTSRRFLQKMQHLDLGQAQDLMVCLEELRGTISLMDKIKAKGISLRSVKGILQAFFADNIREDNVAVILFTSGTEGLPKAAQLTHKNILSNQEACLDLIDLHSDDVLISVLPFFHVFGFSITGLLPLIYGYRAFYSPDPTDGHTIGHQIMVWKASIIILAPTFYDNLFKCCSFRQLRSLRLFVSGAEKASQQLMEAVHKLGEGVSFCEGYGLTETSPVISVNPPHSFGHGVGKKLDNLDVCIIHPETLQVLKETQSGEICVSGPSVFLGYYGSKVDPFIIIRGKKYLRTGDKGRIDRDGYIYLEGRYKRFVKKGGEIINLAIMEEELFMRAIEKKIIPPDWTHRPFVIMANESIPGAPKLVLFSEAQIDVDQANELLRAAKFSRLFKINEVRIIEEIPLLSSGKVCLGTLGEML